MQDYDKNAEIKDITNDEDQVPQEFKELLDQVKACAKRHGLAVIYFVRSADFKEGQYGMLISENTAGAAHFGLDAANALMQSPDMIRAMGTVAHKRMSEKIKGFMESINQPKH